ncbi:hypothetical protein [Priestia megaterium]|uniref:hypothetical protein n=1 Tax=Priestia megaterium TaxID=1404 RepID=UPI00116EB1D9|nr:hypothetical protein [Priestia megaterium]
MGRQMHPKKHRPLKEILLAIRLMIRNIHSILPDKFTLPLIREKLIPISKMAISKGKFLTI